MALNFIQVVDDCVALLQANESTDANAKFKAIGNQILSDTPDEAFVEGDAKFLGTVRAYHKSSDFPFGSGSRNSSVKHNFTIPLEFKTAAKAKGDLTVLSQDSPDPAAVITALANVQNAELIANGKMDNLFSRIYEIIMNLESKNLGSSITVASRWIGKYEKDDPVRFGAIVALTAGATITGSISEGLTGAAVVAQPTEKNYDSDLISTYDETGADVSNAEIRVTK